MRYQGSHTFLKTLKEICYPRFTLAPGCDWVQARLGAYLSFDLPKSHFRAVERHLGSCTACMAEYESTGRLHRALCQNAIAPLGLMTPQNHAGALSARIRAEQAKKAQIRGSVPGTSPRLRPRLQPRGVLVVAALLLVVVPVLAYVGHGAWQGLYGQTSGETACRELTAPAGPSYPSDSNPIDSADLQTEMAPADGGASTIAPVTPGAGSAVIDREIKTQVARAEVAFLPQAEEEYEAWARREYPHILWLYDVLSGERPQDPPDSAAGRAVHFGADDSGDPTITLSGAEGLPVTISIPLFAREPWNGSPINIPDWAKRLYEDTPESQRPTGWRALVVYSGEVFKLDWPQNLDGPNCVPTAAALGAAAALAPQTSAEFFVNPTFRSYAADAVPAPEMPSGYVVGLSCDFPRVKSVVQYVYVSALLVGTNGFREVTDSANTVLDSLGESNAQCSEAALAKALAGLLGSRNMQASSAVRSWEP